MQPIAPDAPALQSAALRLGAFAAAAVLASCNGVVSSTPWFGPADAAGAPRLREGVWRVTDPGKPCAVDERQPIAAWPDCAGAVLVGPRNLVAFTRQKEHRRPTPVDYRLAAGEPVILQAGGGGSDDYEYMWVRITGLDDAGGVVAITGWRVLCGPPSSTADKPLLYPGLANKDGDCTAASREALQGAARASEADATQRSEAHWVRAGSR